MNPEVLFDQQGGVGIIELNRPKSLNALNLNMIRLMDQQLQRWEQDDGIKVVLIKGAGDKAFCAGGDVRAIWQAGQAQDPLTDTFFREEYRLNRRIHEFPKPYVALLDGIVMGGGVGVSVHGSHRIVTERTLFAMPEAAIGIFPDVGASWFLQSCPGHTGLYLGMSSARLNGAECLAVNMATHFVSSDKLKALEKALIEKDWDQACNVDAILGEFSSAPGEAPLSQHMELIDRCFSAPSVESIFAALEQDGSEFSANALKLMRKNSPLSLKLTVQQLRAAKTLSFDECMAMEFRLMQACMAGTEFYEGVRAMLVDKDFAPKWTPSSIEQVSDESVAQMFEPLGDRELTFD